MLAGVSHCSVYNPFPGKQALLSADMPTWSPCEDEWLRSGFVQSYMAARRKLASIPVSWNIHEVTCRLCVFELIDVSQLLLCQVKVPPNQ